MLAYLRPKEDQVDRHLSSSSLIDDRSKPTPRLCSPECPICVHTESSFTAVYLLFCIGMTTFNTVGCAFHYCNKCCQEASSLPCHGAIVSDHLRSNASGTKSDPSTCLVHSLQKASPVLHLLPATLPSTTGSRRTTITFSLHNTQFNPPTISEATDAQSRTDRRPLEMSLIARRFSVTNFLIATSALGFQVFVLYPWHTKLDDDFAALRRENLKLIQRLDGKFAESKG